MFPGFQSSWRKILPSIKHRPRVNRLEDWKSLGENSLFGRADRLCCEFNYLILLKVKYFRTDFIFACGFRSHAYRTIDSLLRFHWTKNSSHGMPRLDIDTLYCWCNWFFESRLQMTVGIIRRLDKDIGQGLWCSHNYFHPLVKSELNALLPMKGMWCEWRAKKIIRWITWRIP